MPHSGVDGDDRQSLPMPLLPLLLQLLMLLDVVAVAVVVVVFEAALQFLELELLQLLVRSRSLASALHERVGDADGEEVQVDGHELDN